MKFSATELSHIEAPYDLCIIGSGPAGLTIALELKYSGLRICVLESGSQSLSPALDDLKAVQSEGLPIRLDSRERVLGGATERWSGIIAPLDPIDFEHRPGIHSGWPISLSEVNDALEARGHCYGIPSHSAFDFHAESGLPALPSLQPKVFRTQTPPLRFGTVFEHAFLPRGFDIYLGATALELVSEPNGDSRRVTEAIVADSTGARHRVSAGTFVLAASTIETSRLLLNSGGLGNEQDQVGRYFMNHPKGNVGTVVFDEALAPDHPLFRFGYGSFAGYIGLRLPEKVQREKGYMNSYVRFERGRDEEGFEEAGHLSRALRETVKSVRRLNRPQLLASGREALRRSPALAQLLLRNTLRMVKKRESAVKAARIRCFVDMEPLADNRIELTSQKDRFGMARPVVRHALSSRDLASVDALLNQVADSFRAAGLGQIKRFAGNLAAQLDTDASHHLGGARMGTDPKTSVVDPSLKLHSADNLYVSGGAVFPSGGCANPTLTIIGLSLRLADHLKHRLKTAPAPTPATNGAGIIVIGAGRRVREDVVPAIEALEPEAFVSGVYATRRNTIFGVKRAYEVEPLENLSEDEIRSAKIIYLAVPARRVKAILAYLGRYDCSEKTLVVDTPALPPADVSDMYASFRQTCVAEDSICLPWTELVRRAGRVSRITFDQSAYRYHAAALARDLARQPEGARPHIEASRGKKKLLSIAFDGGMTADVKSPRDYATGRITMQMSSGQVLSSHSDRSAKQVELVIEDGVCAGFRLGTDEERLSDIESRLLGRVDSTDTIVSRMLDVKRVGLYRLLRDVLSSTGSPYTVQEAVADAALPW